MNRYREESATSGPPTVVTDCPRCGAKRMTFDILADVFCYIQYDWLTHHELAVGCRRCGMPSILKVELRNAREKNEFRASGTISRLHGDIESTFQIEGFVTVADLEPPAEPPEHLPEDVESAFKEGAKCIAIGCFNAAAAMFRLSLDQATKPLLPDPSDKSVKQPSKEERYKLGKRIDWLISVGKIPTSLSKLAHAVREDGNDGVHDGSLAELDAADLLDFATALFQRLYTEPERLRLAELRRDDRRA